MNQTAAHSNDKHAKNDNRQGDNDRFDNYENESRNNELDIGDLDKNLDVHLDQLDPLLINEQNDYHNEETAISNSSKRSSPVLEKKIEQITPNNKEIAISNSSARSSPVLEKKREQKKAKVSSYKPLRRGTNRDRHRDISQDNKRKLGVPATVSRNSPLTPSLQEGGNLDRILTGIPYHTDSGENSEVTVQLLNAQIQSLKEELENLIQECVTKDEMVTLLEERLKDTEIVKSKLQKEIASKDRLVDKLKKSMLASNEKCDGISKELDLINKEYLELKSSIVNKEHELKQIKSKVRARDEILVKREETTYKETDALKQKTVFVKQLRKEVDVLKQSQRQAAIVKSNLEAKINRALEENERLKNETRRVKQASKESSDRQQKRLEESGERNRRLERQNLELYDAIKKQMKLILNLKRQTIHVEAATAVKFAEEEFMKAIDK